MKIIVFGATGTVGRHLITQSLDEGHSVTAFSRNIQRLAINHNKLAKVQGNVLKTSEIENAITGHDAVIVVLGAGLKGQVRSVGTLNIIKAMKEKRIKRLICQSTLGVGASWGNLNFYWKYLMFSGLLRKVYSDHVLQEKYVQESDLDWTIVRPSAFTDGGKTGLYRHGFSEVDRNTTLKISRADVADFLLKQLSDLRYLHKSPGISY